MKIAIHYIFFVLLLISSCKKTEDIIPNQTLFGVWRFQTMDGSVDIGGKTLPLTKNLDFGFFANEITLKEGGVGEIDKRPITYKMSGNVLTIIKDGKNIPINFRVSDGVLNITVDEIVWKQNIATYNNAKPVSSKITKFNQTLIFKTLPAILKSNGTPECVTSSYKTSSPQSRYSYLFNYNDENKVIKIATSNVSTNATSLTIYQEEKANLGSETLPYVIEFTNDLKANSYYCDQSGRVNRVEAFSQTTFSNIPASITYYEYNKDGFNIKRIVKSKNISTGELTGEDSIYEYEYVNGDLSKTFLTTYKGTTASGPRFLLAEFERTAIPVKSKFVYLFNFGTQPKNYSSKITSYQTNGSVNQSLSRTVDYKLDSKGYVTAQTISFLDGTKHLSNEYTYVCQ